MADKAKPKKKKQRIVIFDKLRGIAVLLMILSHSVDFFYSGDNLIMTFIRWFGATLAFSMFLYISGAVSYLAYLWHAEAEEVWDKKQARLLSRSGHILLIYYVIAFFGNYRLLTELTADTIGKYIAKTLLFIEVPSYSEFMIPFIFYTVLLLVLGKYIKRIATNQILVFLIGIAAFLIGTYFYQIDFGTYGNYYKSLLFGHERWFRFPIFQYFPIFIFGIYTGYLKTHGTARAIVTKMTTYGGVMATALFVIIIQTWQQIIGTPAVYITRWPPSLSFILVGLVFAISLLLILQLYEYISAYGAKEGFLTFIGKNAYLYYVYHMLILYTYEMTIDYRFSDIWLVFGMFSLLLALSSTIIMLRGRLGFKFGIIESIEMKAYDKSQIMSKVYKALALGAVVLCLFLINLSLNSKPADIVAANVEGISFQPPTYNDEWWNEDFQHYLPFTIENNSGINVMGSEETIGLTIDHAQLVADNKSFKDGRDLEIIHWQNDGFEVLDFTIQNPNTDNTLVYFKPITAIAPGANDSNYFLYYNNPGSDVTPPAEATITTTYTEYSIRFGEEEGANFDLALNRAWFLKDINNNNEVENVSYTINIKNFEELRDQDLRVILTEPSGDEDIIVPTKLAPYSYAVTLDPNELAIGKYQIRTIIDDTQFVSPEDEFFISYPLYVTWTMDWEGYDVSETYLNAMDDIANKYDMPLTTFFNPRIFAAEEISEARRERLVRWALAGADSRGDEIALHLHMHLDMIEQTEVEEVLTEPRWGGRENGHDVLTTAYGYDDFKLIVEWGLDKYQEYGLPKPASYRAGGWFIDEENLQVLEDLDFRLDSSGREAIIYGPNRVENPWHLSSTTSPYRPSVRDQNSAVSPTLNLWEFPNNGMDSTNHDLDVLLEKFGDNYDGDPLAQYQVLTYLSHPHWLSTYDEADIRGLLDYLESYKYDNDKGPVVYTTLVGALNNIEN